MLISSQCDFVFIYLRHSWYDPTNVTINYISCHIGCSLQKFWQHLFPIEHLVFTCVHYDKEIFILDVNNLKRFAYCVLDRYSKLEIISCTNLNWWQKPVGVPRVFRDLDLFWGRYTFNSIKLRLLCRWWEILQCNKLRFG